MKNILLLLISFFLISCEIFVDNLRAIEAAEKVGFKNIVILERHDIFPWIFGCDKDDNIAFEMSGKNRNNKQVEFIVCCGGIVRGCVLRN